MTQNGAHDDNLLEQIERLLADGKPTGDPLLDDLARSAPEASPEFRQQLENQVMAKVSHQYEIKRRTEQMNTGGNVIASQFPERISPQKRRPIRLPFTLVAAALATIIGGIVLFMGATPPSNPSFMALQTDSTETPISAPLTTIPATPIAEILRSLVVRSGPGVDYPEITTLEAPEVVEIRGISEDRQWYQVVLPDGSQGWIVTAGTYINFIGNRDALQVVPAPTYAPVNVTTMTPSPTYVPVNMTTTPPVMSTATVTPTPSPVIFTDIPPTMMHPSAVTDMPTVPPPGMQPMPDSLSLWALSTSITSLKMQPVVIALQDIPGGTYMTADMLAVTYWPENILPDQSLTSVEPMVGIAVNEDIERWQPVLLENISVQTGELTYLTELYLSAEGKVVVAVSLERINDTDYAVRAGEVVDLAVTLMYVDMGDGFQEIVPNNEAVQVNSHTIEDVEVLQMIENADGEPGDTIVLAVTAGDALVLNWLIETGIEITLLPSE